jgi:hypothetical protein
MRLPKGWGWPVFGLTFFAVGILTAMGALGVATSRQAAQRSAQGDAPAALLPLFPTSPPAQPPGATPCAQPQCAPGQVMVCPGGSCPNFCGMICAAPTPIPPTAPPPTERSVATPAEITVNFGVEFVQAWLCGSQGRITFRVRNGQVALSSMSFRLNGPGGSFTAQGSSNNPFFDNPADAALCAGQGKGELGAGKEGYIYLSAIAPAKGSAGKLTISLCSKDGGGGSCAQQVLDFVY